MFVSGEVFVVESRYEFVIYFSKWSLNFLCCVYFCRGGMVKYYIVVGFITSLEIFLGLSKLWDLVVISGGVWVFLGFCFYI